jgi:hypothetical protein
MATMARRRVGFGRVPELLVAPPEEGPLPPPSPTHPRGPVRRPDQSWGRLIRARAEEAASQTGEHRGQQLLARNGPARGGGGGPGGRGAGEGASDRASMARSTISAGLSSRPSGTAGAGSAKILRRIPRCCAGFPTGAPDSPPPEMARPVK